MKPKGNVPMVPRHVSGAYSESALRESLMRDSVQSADFSIADASVESLQALQDLVSTLEPPMRSAQSTDDVQNDRAVSSADSGDELLLKLLAIASCKTRAEAIKSLVQRLAREFPGASVHAGIGGKRLRRFCDSSLGWLGAESELFRNFAQTWREDPQDDLSQTSVVVVSANEVLYRLERPGQARHRGDDCIVIRIAGESLDANLAQTLERWSEPLAAILWGRPTWAVPQWAYLSGNRLKIALAAAGVLMLLLMFPTPYRIHAAVRIEPQSPRIVSAPFEAIIESVSVQPGDEVKAGQTLVTFDGRPLRLERQSLEAEIYQSAKQKDIALAAGRIAEAQQAQLKYQQLLRRRDLIDRRLDQLVVSSPIDGVVVSGDLRRSVGASLELGRVLIEIAPLDRVLVEIAIPEYEISMVKENAASRIRVDASGSPTIHQPITEIYPAGELREDEVVFISLIELDNQGGEFRPGMTGKATVYGDHRPFIWPYVRRTIDQVTWMVGL